MVESGITANAIYQIAQLARPSDDVGVLNGHKSGQWYRNTAAEVAVFSYARDFSELWGLAESGKDESNGLGRIADEVWQRPSNRSLTIIVVCDGLPPSGERTIDMTQYVNPFDWAVVFSWSVLKRSRKGASQVRLSEGKGESRPKIRILLVELDSRAYVHTFSRRTFIAMRSAFPWIQIYQLVGTATLDDDTVLDLCVRDPDAFARIRTVMSPGRFGTEQLLKDLLTSEKMILATFDDTAERDCVSEVEAAMGLWRSYLLRPVKRHTVANIMGPLFLARGLSDEISQVAIRDLTKGFPLRQAFGSLIEEIEVGTAYKKEAGVDSKGIVSKDGGIFDRRNNIRFLLTDDQYSLGYHHVLAYALFGRNYRTSGSQQYASGWKFAVQGKGVLQCMPCANMILTELENRARVNDWTEPRYLGAPWDVLLLDLRIWSEDDTKSRKNFFERLVGICGHLGATEIKGDQALTKALDSAHGLAGGSRDGEIKALALLPLLLSHYDPSLPIILFSSTHQRTVLEMVAAHPNVISDFSKPILSGYGETQSSGDMVRDLRRALRKAIDLHEARIVWKRIVELNIGPPPAFEIPPRKYNEGGQYTADWRQKDSLSRVVASYYRDYILTGNYSDFFAVPPELIEGSLFPEEVLKDPRWSDARLMFDNSGPVGHIVNSLKWCRHRKVHGAMYAEQVGGQRWDVSTRACCLLMFLFLLDLLTNANYPWTHIEKHVRNKLVGALKRKHRELRTIRLLRPGDLVMDTIIRGDEFVLLALASALRHQQGVNRLLHGDTVAALNKAVDDLISRMVP